MTHVCDHPVTLPIGKNAVVYFETVTVQLPYMAVPNLESGKALLLFRETHLPS